MVDKFMDRKGNIVIKPDGRIIENRVSVYGIARQGRKILFVRPTWKEEFDLPGGGIETNEAIHDGLRREFLEETGFLVRIAEIKPVKVNRTMFYADDIDKYFKSKQLFFLVEITSDKNSEIINKSEIRDCVWFDLDTLESEPVNKLHLGVLRDLMRNNAGC